MTKIKDFFNFFSFLYHKITIPKGGVAFFDSGIGGLTTFAVCRARIPDEVFYYFGDNIHAPYGNFSPRKIMKYTQRAFKVFKRLQVRAVVIACNTVTAVCIESLRKRYAFPIIGAEPAVKMAMKEGGDVLVLTTMATASTVRFQKLCAKTMKNYPKGRLEIAACKELAGAVENRIGENFDWSIYLPQRKPDKVVLGCTHYIYIKEWIKEYYHCVCFDGNEGIANRLTYILRAEKNGDLTPTVKNVESCPLLTKIHNFCLFCISFLIKKQKRKRGNVINADKNFTSVLDKRTYFLGKSHKYNKNIYEQMFIFNKNV